MNAIPMAVVPLRIVSAPRVAPIVFSLDERPIVLATGSAWQLSADGGAWAGVPAPALPADGIVLQAVGPNQYRGTVYRDLMRDEDYYGRGVCHWQFSGAGALLKASDAAGQTRFTHFISAAQIEQGQTATRHYPAGDYPQVAGMADYGQAGKADADSYVAALRDQLFSATLHASKAGL